MYGKTGDRVKRGTLRGVRCTELCSIFTLRAVQYNDQSVERPDPKGLSTFFVSAPSSRRIGDSNSCPQPDLELGAVRKWLASRC
jgi:hypothetical protein